MIILIESVKIINYTESVSFYHEKFPFLNYSYMCKEVGFLHIYLFLLGIKLLLGDTIKCVKF